MKRIILLALLAGVLTACGDKPQWAGEDIAAHLEYAANLTPAPDYTFCDDAPKERGATSDCVMTFYDGSTLQVRVTFQNVNPGHFTYVLTGIGAKTR